MSDLSLISDIYSATNFKYTYPDSAGKGVAVYIIGKYAQPVQRLTMVQANFRLDTGINTEHVRSFLPAYVYFALILGQIEFGGRAKWGTTIGGYANKDGNGHGTHCAYVLPIVSSFLIPDIGVFFKRHSCG